MRRLTAMSLGLLVVLATATPAAAASTTVRHVIRTSQWSTPSPDPTGLALVGGQLLVTDSEVDETGVFEHRNMWRVTRSGTVRRTMSTTSFSDEPTDVAVDASANVWYFSDDGSFGGVRGRIFVRRLGPDGRYGTGDDRRRSFSTGAFGSTDPEGLSFGDGNLWISDGTSGIVYRLDPGANGQIEGAGADDVITQLNLSGLGVTDIEGVEYWHGRLFVLANKPNADILEINPGDGSLVRAFDLSTAGLRHPSSLAYGASSQNPARRSFYVADRGVDNGANPRENDGRIVELGVAPRPANLIRNNGFERDANRDRRPDSWTPNVHFSRTTLARHDGTYAGLHRTATDVSYSVRQDLSDVVAGETYHFEGWTKIPSTDTFTYRIRILWFASNGTTISTSNLAKFTTQKLHWARSTRDVVAPPGTVRGRFVMSISGLRGRIYVDSFSLTVVS